MSPRKYTYIFNYKADSLRDSNLPWLCLGEGCRPKGLHQACALWTWDSKDLLAPSQLFLFGNRYRRNEPPSSCQKSDRSLGLKREMETNKERMSLTDQFLFPDLTGKGLSWA